MGGMGPGREGTKRAGKVTWRFPWTRIWPRRFMRSAAWRWLQRRWLSFGDAEGGKKKVSDVWCHSLGALRRARVRDPVFQQASTAAENQTD
jgi:hypothetical protein